MTAVARVPEEDMSIFAQIMANVYLYSKMNNGFYVWYDNIWDEQCRSWYCRKRSHHRVLFPSCKVQTLGGQSFLLGTFVDGESMGRLDHLCRLCPHSCTLTDLDQMITSKRPEIREESTDSLILSFLLPYSAAYDTSVKARSDSNPYLWCNALDLRLRNQAAVQRSTKQPQTRQVS